MKIQNPKSKIQNVLIIVFLVFLFLSLVPNLAQAALVPCGPGTPKTQCEFCDIFVLLNNILIFLLIPNAEINGNFPLIPTVAALMLIIGGFYLLIAGPSPANVNQAKSVITAAVIGLVIVFIAWVFLNTFLDMIGVATWTGLKNWWEISCP